MLDDSWCPQTLTHRRPRHPNLALISSSRAQAYRSPLSYFLHLSNPSTGSPLQRCLRYHLLCLGLISLCSTDLRAELLLSSSTSLFNSGGPSLDLPTPSSSAALFPNPWPHWLPSRATPPPPTSPYSSYSDGAPPLFLYRSSTSSSLLRHLTHHSSRD